MPDADLIGTEVILTSSEGTFMYGGLGERGDAISIKFSLRGMPNIVTCDVSCVAPADTPVDLKDPRINVVKLAKKRGYYDAGFWLPGITYLPDWSPRTTRTKTEATAYCARRVAIDDFHRASRRHRAWQHRPRHRRDGLHGRRARHHRLRGQRPGGGHPHLGRVHVQPGHLRAWGDRGPHLAWRPHDPRGLARARARERGHLHLPDSLKVS
jgi:hypothetical protein